MVVARWIYNYHDVLIEHFVHVIYELWLHACPAFNAIRPSVSIAFVIRRVRYRYPNTISRTIIIDLHYTYSCVNIRESYFQNEEYRRTEMPSPLWMKQILYYFLFSINLLWKCAIIKSIFDYRHGRTLIKISLESTFIWSQRQYIPMTYAMRNLRLFTVNYNGPYAYSSYHECFQERYKYTRAQQTTRV